MGKPVPTMAERGAIGAANRWGPPRRVNLRDLSADQRRLVLALIEAERDKNQRSDAPRRAA